MKIPPKICFKLKMFNNNKPNLQFFSFFNGEYNMGYESIKGGGRVLWVIENTKEKAENKVKKWLKQYNIKVA